MQYAIVAGWTVEIILHTGYLRYGFMPKLMEALIVEQAMRADDRARKATNPKAAANVVGYRTRRVTQRIEEANG